MVVQYYVAVQTTHTGSVLRGGMKYSHVGSVLRGSMNYSHVGPVLHDGMKYSHGGSVLRWHAVLKLVRWKMCSLCI